MSSTRCELVNWLLVPLFSIVVCLCFLNLGVLEFYILTGYCVFTLVSHILFGICVVSIGQSMLNHISRDDSKVDTFIPNFLATTDRTFLHSPHDKDFHV